MISDLRARQGIAAAFVAGLLLRLVLVSRPLVALDRQFIPDDTYYTLGIARSLGRGHGPTIQGVSTSGFQPLLAFLMAPVSDVTSRDGLLRATLVVLVLCDVACILLLARLAWRLGGPLAGLVAAVLWAASPVATAVALDGLETTLALAVALALVEVWWTARERDDRRWWWAAGALSGLAVLARVDLLVLVGLLGVIELSRRGWRHVTTAAVPAAVVLGPWWIWCWARFGSPLPESGSAVHQITLLHRSLALSRSRALGLAGGELAGGPFDDLRGLRNWLFVHDGTGIVLLVVAVLALLALAVWAARRSSWPVTALALHALVLLGFYGTYLTAPWFYRRYLHAVIAVLVLGLAVVLARAWGTRLRWPAVGLGGAATVLGLVLVVGQVVDSPADSGDRGYNGVEGYREVAQQVLAQVPPGAVLGSLQSGALSYYAPPGIRVVNLDGVVDHRAARAVTDHELSQWARAAGITMFADWQFNADNLVLRLTADPAQRLVLTPTATAVPQAGDRFVLFRVGP